MSAKSCEIARKFIGIRAIRGVLHGVTGSSEAKSLYDEWLNRGHGVKNGRSLRGGLTLFLCPSLDTNQLILCALGYGSIATMMKCKMQSEWLETTASLAHAHVTILSSFRQYQGYGYGRCQDLKIDNASEFANSWADANDGRS
eukprot:scaffold1586_cov63-Cyclotella_meneghiniana.AAC.2